MMKVGIKVTALLLIIFGSAQAERKPGGWVIGGVQYGRLMGRGMEGNRFDPGVGGVAEIAFGSPRIAWVIYGTGLYYTKNWVYGDKAKARFYTPFYSDIRIFLSNGNIRPLLTIGAAFSRMHFEKTNGSDNQWQFVCGTGFQILFSGGELIQVLIKPYSAYDNTLKQTWGIETNIAFGGWWSEL